LENRISGNKFLLNKKSTLCIIINSIIIEYISSITIFSLLYSPRLRLLLRLTLLLRLLN
jgi:hypothetical protein